MRDETLTEALVGSMLRLALASFLLAPLVNLSGSAKRAFCGVTIKGVSL